MYQQAQQHRAESCEQQYQALVGRHGPPVPPRVLALGTCERGRVELLQHADGSVAIDVGGAEVPAFHWPAAEEENCVATFLRLISR